MQARLVSCSPSREYCFREAQRPRPTALNVCSGFTSCATAKPARTDFQVSEPLTALSWTHLRQPGAHENRSRCFALHQHAQPATSTNPCSPPASLHRTHDAHAGYQLRVTLQYYSRSTAAERYFLNWATSKDVVWLVSHRWRILMEWHGCTGAKRQVGMCSTLCDLSSQADTRIQVNVLAQREFRPNAPPHLSRTEMQGGHNLELPPYIKAVPSACTGAPQDAHRRLPVAASRKIRPHTARAICKIHHLIAR